MVRTVPEIHVMIESIVQTMPNLKGYDHKQAMMKVSMLNRIEMWMLRSEETCTKTMEWCLS